MTVRLLQSSDLSSGTSSRNGRSGLALIVVGGRDMGVVL